MSSVVDKSTDGHLQAPQSVVVVVVAEYVLCHNNYYTNIDSPSIGVGEKLACKLIRHEWVTLVF